MQINRCVKVMEKFRILGSDMTFDESFFPVHGTIKINQFCYVLVILGDV